VITPQKEKIFSLYRKKGGTQMKRVVHYKASKKAMINIMASGLTRDEIGHIEEVIRSIARKRRHGKRKKLLYDLVFND
jgi:hypothetical protein